MKSYDELVAEALAAPFEGWDFSWLEVGGRATHEELSWSYPSLARQAIAQATSVLDIDTGGGELLASFAPFDVPVVATEGWEPNVAVARDRLGPLGVDVRRSENGSTPARDGEFDLVLNRHGHCDPAELFRVLLPGGVVLMQHVGRDNDAELNQELGAAPPKGGADSAEMVASLQRNGFRILEARAEMPEFVFHDIGAVVYQLRAVSWQIPDFDVQRYDAELRALDARIRCEGSFVAHDRRFLIRARRSEGLAVD